MKRFLFKAITDRNYLKWLRHLKTPTGILARCSLGLLEYDFEIIQRKGTLNRVPDALYRISEKDKLPFSSTGEQIDIQFERSTDPWYNKRLPLAMVRPWILSEWRVEDGELYRHRRNEVTDQLGPD